MIFSWLLSPFICANVICPLLVLSFNPLEFQLLKISWKAQPVITFLGIEFDAAKSIIRLPNDKLSELIDLVRSWHSRKKCVKRELLSLIGSLSFACKVIKPGRIFLRRLIDLSTTVSKLHHHIDLTQPVRADLKMWSKFLQSWNGCSSFLSPPVSTDIINLFTDASFLGFGAYFDNLWFSEAWPDSVQAAITSRKINIAFLELFSVLVSVSSWGDILRHCQIVGFTDNEAIVSIWSSGSSKEPNLMALVRVLFFLSVEFNCSITFHHVPGKWNLFADLLSRLQVQEFKLACPTAAPQPSIIPDSIMATLDEILQDL